MGITENGYSLRFTKFGRAPIARSYFAIRKTRNVQGKTAKRLYGYFVRLVAENARLGQEKATVNFICFLIRNHLNNHSLVVVFLSRAQLIEILPVGAKSQNYFAVLAHQCHRLPERGSMLLSFALICTY